MGITKQQFSNLKRNVSSLSQKHLLTIKKELQQQMDLVDELLGER